MRELEATFPTNRPSSERTVESYKSCTSHRSYPFE